ncbi:FhaA domain-containing protein [uncultured Jatrophihabitans sp.]|uniref:FhaA domain-containing protein n=1 Tax=uncultured Jatrophihabitans sp. TaxID=1610747 RepID=UPI0035CA3A41
MSLAQRFERRLEGLVGGAFARVFKGQVEPVEIGTALQREASDKRSVMGKGAGGGGAGGGQVLSPNRYRVTLSPSDHDRLVPWEVQLTNSLAELVQEYLDENQWTTIGDIEVYLARDDELHTGVFGVASRMEPGAPPRRRPHDSLSLPIVPGMSPGEYPDDEQYGQGGYAEQPAYAAPVPQEVPDAPYSPAPPPAPYARQSYGPPGFPASPGNGGYAAGYGGGPGFAAPPAPPAPPARVAQASLIVDQTNRRFELRTGNNVIGRGTDADLQLLDQGISRRHVDIQFDGNVATAYDLGSTNGTTVNGHEINSQLLRHGDVLRVGHTRIVFHQDRS